MAGAARRRPRILVAALGNELLMDDGVGIHAARLLKAERHEHGVVIAEIGTAVLSALHLLEKADSVLVLDAIQTGKPPGTVCTFNLDPDRTEQAGISLHELSIRGALRMIAPEKRPCHITVVGAEPALIDYGMELSPDLAAGLPEIVEAAKQVLQRWSIDTVLRHM